MLATQRWRRYINDRVHISPLGFHPRSPSRVTFPIPTDASASMAAVTVAEVSAYDAAALT